jgi:hypothetical protein
MELMNKLARVDALQKVLVLIHDMLEGKGWGNICVFFCRN